MSFLAQDDNANSLQLFAPYENRTGVTELDVRSEGILAIMLPSAAQVQINSAGTTLEWPAAIYAVPHLSTVKFSAATDVVIMKRGHMRLVALLRLSTTALQYLVVYDLLTRMLCHG